MLIYPRATSGLEHPKTWNQHSVNNVKIDSFWEVCLWPISLGSTAAWVAGHPWRPCGLWVWCCGWRGVPMGTMSQLVSTVPAAADWVEMNDEHQNQIDSVDISSITSAKCAWSCWRLNDFNAALNFWELHHLKFSTDGWSWGMLCCHDMKSRRDVLGQAVTFSCLQVVVWQRNHSQIIHGAGIFTYKTGSFMG